MSGLVERLRAPDWHDPKCPFDLHCYCGDDSELPPHDRVRHPDALEAATAIEERDAEIARLREVLDMAAFRMQLLVSRMPPDEDGKSIKALSQSYVDDIRAALERSGE